jgi:transglutaminase-like putative cysteine protease
MFFYRIHHSTHFFYSEPITESIMEVRAQPRNDFNQRCLRFQLVVSPKALSTELHDHLGNIIHSFDVPAQHQKMAIVCESIVQVSPFPTLPEVSPNTDWHLEDIALQQFDVYEMMLPSLHTQQSPALDAFWKELNITVNTDPLTVLKYLNDKLYHCFDYAPTETDVDTPIEHVLKTRRGVCQDFVHVMLALVRNYLKLPCRYVSGYLFHRTKGYERSASDATHAWIEVYLPSLGWIGFDPTNNTICSENHIRVAIGRDYFDVPPTKGVFKGDAATALKVHVKVERLDQVPSALMEERLQPDLSLSIETQAQQIQFEQQQQQQ